MYPHTRALSTLPVQSFNRRRAQPPFHEHLLPNTQTTNKSIKE
jgi:hypothetical protein